MTLKHRQFHLLVICAAIIAVIVLFYPAASNALLATKAHLYRYSYSVPRNLEVKNLSEFAPAEAVPVLMYHGVVVDGTLETENEKNTERDIFIAQMEMLKREGFQTISVKEYNEFIQGKFTLPAKPIILTFDDGRRDSFYTVDEVLEKLGFKATIFIASIKANQSDTFYLTWDELKHMKTTGRWEIEAHGEKSHEDIAVDENGSTGKYLTSRMYIPGQGLESIEDYEKRVEADYLKNIADLKGNLGIDAKYFAIPLNSYGYIDDSNYDGAFALNDKLTRRYFKLAFFQVPLKDGKPIETFYNYKDSNSYRVRRLDVQNISADELLQALEKYEPRNAFFEFPSAQKDLLIDLLYGSAETDEGGIRLTSGPNTSGRMLFGDQGWKNYTVTARIVREKGNSVSLVAYYTDEDNFISLDWSGKLVRLVEYVDGKEHELASYYPWEKTGEVEVLISVVDGKVMSYFSGKMISRNVSTQLSRGAAWFDVWDPEGGAQSKIKRIKIND